MRFVFGEHGESGFIGFRFLAGNKSANGSEGWSFAHSMLGQRAQFAPSRQSIFNAMANGNGFSVCIAMIVVCDHEQIFMVISNSQDSRFWQLSVFCFKYPLKFDRMTFQPIKPKSIKKSKK